MKTEVMTEGILSLKEGAFVCPKSEICPQPCLMKDSLVETALWLEIGQTIPEEFSDSIGTGISEATTIIESCPRFKTPFEQPKTSLPNESKVAFSKPNENLREIKSALRVAQERLGIEDSIFDARVKLKNGSKTHPNEVYCKFCESFPIQARQALITSLRNNGILTSTIPFGDHNSPNTNVNSQIINFMRQHLLAHQNFGAEETRLVRFVGLVPSEDLLSLQAAG